MKKIFRKGFALYAVLAVLLFAGCPNGTTDDDPNGEKAITAFSFGVTGELVDIDEGDHIITVSVLAGTSINALTPVITLSAGASADKTGAQDFSNDLVYIITAEDETTQTYTVRVSVRHELAHTVWAGATPQANGTDWLTITFKDLSAAIVGSTETGRRAICSFSADNSTNNWGFTYDSEARTGTIIVESGWNPAPNGFTISADGKTLTITNYGNHASSPRDFKRLRANDLTIDPVPFTPGALPDDLVNSVWAGGTPQDDGTGWLTITFRDDDEKSVILAFSADNTTNNWPCTDYNLATKKGTLTGAGGWLGGGAFTVSGDGKTLTFDSFMGSPREFKRLR
jgi:hypothetical protein